MTHSYVDRYRVIDVVLFFSVVVMSTTDAFITLRLVSAGGEEINPVMDFFLKLGPVPFLTFKYAVTGACLLFTLVHKEYVFWGAFTGRTLLIVFNIMYGCLLLWEYYLLSKLAG